MEDLTNVDFIACGNFHTVCKKYNNDIFVWGLNITGQLGIGYKSVLGSIYKCKD